MIQFDPLKHHRRSIRLKGYDYSKEGYYFITICYVDKAKIFGQIIDDQMILNDFGRITDEEWLNTANAAKTANFMHTSSCLTIFME